MKPPVNTAPRSISPNAPSGPIVSQAACCPDVATFEGSTGARNTYIGFDDKTNLVANVGVDEYWIPPADPKTLPGNKETRDGARWVSVGVGQEAQLEINFGGTFTVSCIGNCKYEFDDPTIAEVTSVQPTAKKAVFKIKGKAAGEASLKVMCDGKLRGYFHIWCEQPAVIEIDFVSIVSGKSTGSTISLATLKQELQETLGQAALIFVINDLGTADISGLKPFAAVEPTFYNAKDEFESNPASLAALQGAAKGIVNARPAGADKFSAKALELYYYVPPKIAGGTVGSVINVGTSPAFTFVNDPQLTYNTTAHEIGHSLDLVHPSDTQTGGGASQTAQFPAHHISTLNVTTQVIPATNTEPAVPAGAGGRGSNILAADPLNLMGYWDDFQQAKPIRYHQWKSCRRQA